MNLETCCPQKLKRATSSQLNEIYSHFYKCRTWFPHIRKDYVDRNIHAGNVIYDEGIIIIFNRYKRKQKIGDLQAQKGDVILHQILNPQRYDYNVPNSTNTKGIAERIIKQFCEEMNANVWLSVRADNDRAIAFYHKCDFEDVSKISWMKGKLKGLVFLKRKEYTA